MKPLNIIYIISHDLGRHLGCYGAPVESPNLDAFAEKSLLFTNAFCNAPCCSPSRGVAMTGLYAHTNGMIGLSHCGWYLPAHVKTVVHHLNDAGYDTIHVGHQHEGPSQTLGYKTDFEHVHEDSYCENAFTRAAEFLCDRMASGDQNPFYLNIGTKEVHASEWSRLDRNTLRERAATVYDAVPLNEPVTVPPYIHDTSARLADEMTMFHKVIKYYDQHLGRFLDEVQSLGLLENTLVIVTTDHGISNMRSKTWLYDRGVEIALMMHMPASLHRSGLVDDLLPNIDLAPTILEACGVRPPEYLQGRSFWPLLCGASYTPHEAIFIERNFHKEYGVDDYDPVRSVRTPQFHLIWNMQPHRGRAWRPDDDIMLNENSSSYIDIWPRPNQPRDEFELYDVLEDPLEMNNLADDPAHAPVLESLHKRILTWMTATDDFALSGQPPPKTGTAYSP